MTSPAFLLTIHFGILKLVFIKYFINRNNFTKVSVIVILNFDTNKKFIFEVTKYYCHIII
jgi:hypothetical protein